MNKTQTSALIENLLHRGIDRNETNFESQGQNNVDRRLYWYLNQQGSAIIINGRKLNE